MIISRLHIVCFHPTWHTYANTDAVSIMSCYRAWLYQTKEIDKNKGLVKAEVEKDWMKRVCVDSLNPSQSGQKERGCVGCIGAFIGTVSYQLFQTLPESHVLVIQWSVSLSGCWMALNPETTDPWSPPSRGSHDLQQSLTAPYRPVNSAVFQEHGQGSLECFLTSFMWTPLSHAISALSRPVPIFLNTCNRHSVRRAMQCQSDTFLVFHVTVWVGFGEGTLTNRHFQVGGSLFCASSLISSW